MPDITVEGAFDNSLKDVTYIEHIASPLPQPTDNPERDIIAPAIHGTTSILNSALRTPSIRRIVITSSLVAVVPGSALSNGDQTTVYTSSSRVRPLPTAPWGDHASAYRASKVLALDATERFLAEKKPHFTVVNVQPGYVIGPHALIEDAEALVSGSNAVVMSVVKVRLTSLQKSLWMGSPRAVSRPQCFNQCDKELPRQPMAHRLHPAQ